MNKTTLSTFINLEHELCRVARKIDWEKLHINSDRYFFQIGRPAIPVRAIVGLIILQQIFDLNDEAALERWLENPYWQHFCGEIYFQYRVPFNLIDLVRFRKRIGENGMDQILQECPNWHKSQKLILVSDR